CEAGEKLAITSKVYLSLSSGDVTPSLSDIQLTARLEKAAKLLQIKLQDHIIIGSGGEYLSMRAEGHIKDDE
ncbi:MAG: JAB domain-containing protein, partial [Enterococcus sp.]